MRSRPNHSKVGVLVRLVLICSPYSGDIEGNKARAQRYCRFAYTQGAVPIAPHLHNPQFLDENIAEERQTGIQLGIELLRRADEIWVFGNRLSEGMEVELRAAQRLKVQVRYFNDRCEEVLDDE